MLLTAYPTTLIPWASARLGVPPSASSSERQRSPRTSVASA